MNEGFESPDAVNARLAGRTVSSHKLPAEDTMNLDHAVLDDARRLSAESSVPVWALAAALQLGYSAGVAIHVGIVIAAWAEYYWPVLKKQPPEKGEQ